MHTFMCSPFHVLAQARHVLKLDNYGGDSVDSWVLLEALT